ncbi:unnamed protein product [Trichobilharzia regenti]|nr:unnamed protein product [Trichobilharzia regenti]
MSGSNLTPKTSAVLPIKGRICTSGGCVGSPEDKIAVLTSDKLYILNFTLSLDGDFKKIASAQEVNFTARCSISIELENDYVIKGSQINDEIKAALKENVNRSILFPYEQTTRDVLHARNGARLVSWSPRGVDKYERWSVDISLIWQQYYLEHGRIAQNRKPLVDSGPQFIFKVSLFYKDMTMKPFFLCSLHSFLFQV